MELLSLSHRRFGYREHSDITAELSLIETLESGKPFGLYLRAFGPYPKYILEDFFNWGSLDRILGEFNLCPFFALDELQRNPHPIRVPSIWVPGDIWQDIAFPLIKEAAVVIINLDLEVFFNDTSPFDKFDKFWRSPFDRFWNFMEGIPRSHIGLVEELEFIDENDLMYKTILIYTQPTPLRKSWGADIASYAARTPCVLTTRNEANLRDRIGMLINARKRVTNGVS